VQVPPTQRFNFHYRTASSLDKSVLSSSKEKQHKNEHSDSKRCNATIYTSILWCHLEQKGKMKKLYFCWHHCKLP